MTTTKNPDPEENRPESTHPKGSHNPGGKHEGGHHAGGKQDDAHAPGTKHGEGSHAHPHQGSGHGESGRHGDSHGAAAKHADGKQSGPKKGGHKEEQVIPDDLPKVKRRTLAFILLGAIVLALVLFVFGFLVRHHRIAKRNKMAEEERDAAPTVLVAPPKKTQKSVELVLPADIRAWSSTALYARTNGYLAKWTADINDRVTKGQVIAVISAPDTDADLEQALASLNQQKTNLDLTKVTEDRYRGLIATQGVTQQQLDTVKSNRKQAEANVGASAASVDRLKALVGFERIVAPFDGVVTTRTYDIGALISATDIAAGQELFDIAEDDKLRVFVSVPQSYALLLKYGQQVKLRLERNFPGHEFSGEVARSSGVLDPVTRTLRTELDFVNDDPTGHILAGMYGEAVFKLDRPEAVLTVPTSALLFEADGKQVAVIGPDNKVQFRKITPGNDYGTEIEVLSGLKGDERIVVNPGENMVEGMNVNAETQKAEDQKPGQPQGSENKADQKKKADGKKPDGKDSGDQSSKDKTSDDKDK